ncbi:hypothetical protein [Malaciobacter marinus]|uniref:hypothetical protein n=1 Tax=Malaciobacter marinus TaxID=505249 RepID=UPI003AFFD2FB
MLIKYFKFVLLFMLIVVLSSCSQKEINQKEYIIKDINVIKSQLNEINNKVNLFELTYKDLKKYNNTLHVELNTTKNQKDFNNKVILKLNNEFVLFKNKIIDIENKLSKVNEYLIKENNNQKQLDIVNIKEEFFLIKEKLQKINKNHIEQITILESQNEKLKEIKKNTISEKNKQFEEKIDKITNQLEIYKDDISSLNKYLTDNKQKKKQIKSEFLIVLVGFYGAIIAFLIPHGIDMVSKIGKLYESEVIADLFRKEAHVNRLHLNLLVAIVVNVLLIFVYEYISYYLLLFPLTHFFIIVYFVGQYINKLNHYTNVDAVLNSIQEDICNEI